jgi:IclR family transcriptional regulator, KDG regulon repressor
MSLTVMKKNRSNYVIQTVSHALDLLEQFTTGDQAEMGVTELSRRLSLHKNNVFRLLATLESRNFIEQDQVKGTYRLGLKNLELGQTITRHLQVQHHARPFLEALAARLDETTYVAILKETRVAYLDAVETTRPVRVVSRLGTWLPAYCTAAGKVHLAAMSNAELRRHLPAELQQYTPNTVTDLAELRQQVNRVALQGYAVDYEEFDLGVRCVSAPVCDCIGRVAGAVSTAGPVSRFSDERLAAEIIPAVVFCAAEVSAMLGFVEHKPTGT